MACHVILAWTAVGCAQAQQTATSAQSRTVMREFRLKNGSFLIDEAQMEAIRSVVVELPNAKRDELHRALSEELRRSIVVVGPNDSRLGPWVLTDRDDHLALVRIPPRDAVNHIFVASLAHERERWVVTEFFEERMKAR